MTRGAGRKNRVNTKHTKDTKVSRCQRQAFPRSGIKSNARCARNIAALLVSLVSLVFPLPLAAT